MRARALGALATAVLILLAACSSGDSDDSTTSSPSPGETVASPRATVAPAQFYAGFKEKGDAVIANSQAQSDPPKSSEIKTQATAVEDLIKYIATSTVPEDAIDLIDNVEKNASLYLETAEDLQDKDLSLEPIDEAEQQVQSLQDAQTQLINAIDNVYNSSQAQSAS